VIIISDSDEEEEVHEETAADADVARSVAEKSLTPTASAADANEDPGKIRDGNSDGLAPDQDIGNNNSGRDEAGLPYATVPRMVPVACLFQGELHSALLLHLLFCVEEWGW
jgi:hypothetical protein